MVKIDFDSSPDCRQSSVGGIELRQGSTLGTFPYTPISRTNADKKARKVLSLAFLPEACCQASFTFFTLCLSFSMVLRTDSSSELSIISVSDLARDVYPALDTFTL